MSQPDQELPEESDDEHQSPSNVVLKSFFALLSGIAVFLVLAHGIHGIVVLTCFPVEAEAMSQARDHAADDQEDKGNGGRDESTAEDDSNDSPTGNRLNTGDSSDDNADDNADDEADNNADDAERDSTDTPAPVEPSSLFWGAGVLIYWIAALLAGALIGRMAPMAPMGHGVFLSVILFLSSLQENENAPFDRPALALAAYAFGVPLAVMIGTWLTMPRDLFSYDPSDETSDDELDSDETTAD